jgi:hypothetical protein
MKAKQNLKKQKFSLFGIEKWLMNLGNWQGFVRPMSKIQWGLLTFPVFEQPVKNSTGHLWLNRNK